MLKEAFIVIFQKPFQEIEKEGILLNSFCDANITLLYHNQTKTSQENYRPIFLMNLDTKYNIDLNKILAI